MKNRRYGSALIDKAKRKISIQMAAQWALSRPNNWGGNRGELSRNLKTD
jgi:hypothetical protein